jgi:hypothetical protein
MMFDVGGGRFARVFLAEGDGFLDPVATPESVRDHFEEILSDRGYETAVDTDAAVARTVALIGQHATAAAL